MYKLSNRSLNYLQGVDAVLIEIIKEAIKDSPYDFGIPSTGGFRTAEIQNELYKKGVSNCDGYKKKSYHQSGRAFDIYAYIDGKASWDEEIMTVIARYIQHVASIKFNIKLTWGGDWKNFKDYPHYQY